MFAPGCSRYAAVEQIPKRKIVRIDINLRQTPTANFYYYFVFEIPDNGDGIGPRAILSGEERARDWSYYVRFNNGFFYEKQIVTLNDRDDIPDILNSSSERYFAAYRTGSTLHIELWMDKLASPIPAEIRMNSITSAAPLTAADTNVAAIDSLRSPFLVINTNQLGTPIRSGEYQNIDTQPVQDTANFPADITGWTVVVEEK